MICLCEVLSSINVILRRNAPKNLVVGIADEVNSENDILTLRVRNRRFTQDDINGVDGLNILSAWLGPRPESCPAVLSASLHLILSLSKGSVSTIG